MVKLIDAAGDKDFIEITKKYEEVRRNILILKEEMLQQPRADYLEYILQNNLEFFNCVIEYLHRWTNISSDQMKDFYEQTNSDDWSCYTDQYFGQ